MTTDRILVMVASGGRTRRYPIPAGVPLHDHYTIDGLRYTVVAVLRDDIPNDVTCHCGTPLVRNGVTVTEHWIGGRCDPCDRLARTLTEIHQ